MAVLTTANLDALEPIMRRYTFLEYDYRANEYPAICNVVQSKKAWETTSGLSDLSYFTQKTEGGDVSYEDVLQGYDKKIINYTYSKGVAVTQEMIEDDLYDKMKQMGTGLGYAAKASIEKSVADLYNNGFVTTYNTCGDGLALFSTAHLKVRGGTFKNRATNDADLSASSLRDAINILETPQSDSSIPIVVRAAKLVVHPDNQFTAMELLKSTLAPETSVNAINPITSWGIKLEVNHFLTDEDAWFLLADKHDVTLQMRQAFDLQKTMDTKNLNALFIGRYRIGVGFNQPRGVFGSAGA